MGDVGFGEGGVGEGFSLKKRAAAEEPPARGPAAARKKNIFDCRVGG
jgi:hypothetical protein